jgi:hypothetical protein
MNLPLNAWVALRESNVITLERLKTVAPRGEQIPGIAPETAAAIRGELERLAARRTLQVRLIFPKSPAATAQTSNLGKTPRPRLRSAAP